MNRNPESKGVPRYYPPVELYQKKQKRALTVPKVAAWGWNDYHICIKILTFAVFLAVVCLTTPFWAFAGQNYTFGLWTFCSHNGCTSIHDNLVDGRSVPAWYSMTQGTFCIGTVASFVGLGILVNNVYDKQLKLSATIHRTVVCVLGISVLQLSVSLFTFVSYFEHTDFLYQRDEMYDVDFHGAFYCGVVAIALIAVSAIIVLIDDDITSATRSERHYNKDRTGPGLLNVSQLRYGEYAYRKLPDYKD